MPLTYFRSAKYQRWYDALIAKAKDREIPKLNTEVHHIWPRSLGGSDEPDNLVRLHYREHFIAHWILTKTCTGPDLRKMQFALFAMTMCANGTRIVSGWQYEVARRALYEPIQLLRARLEKQKREAFEKEIATFRRDLALLQSGAGRSAEGRFNLGALADKLTKYHRFVRDNLPPPIIRDEPIQLGEEPRVRQRKRRPRPGKRIRARRRQAALQVAS